MWWIFLIIAIIFVVACILKFIFRKRDPFPINKYLDAKIIKISDPDTIRIAFDFNLPYKQALKNSYSVRLYGVDAPEGAYFGMEGQPYAKEALKELRKFCSFKEKNKKNETKINIKKNKKSLYLSYKNCKVKKFKNDIYNRSICIVKVDNVDLSLFLLKKGFATIYYGINAVHINLKKMEKIEKKARKLKKGMWKDNVELPSEYKRRIRGK